MLLALINGAQSYDVRIIIENATTGAGDDWIFLGEGAGIPLMGGDGINTLFLDVAYSHVGSTALENPNSYRIIGDDFAADIEGIASCFQ